MARPNTTDHLLTRLREILGLTREQFAERIGVSEVYLIKIERGDRPLTDAIIYRIWNETSIRPDALRRGEITVDPGVEIRRDIYESYRARLERISMSDVDQHVSALALRIEILLDAAVDTKPSRLNVAWCALHSAIDKVEKDLKLQKQTKKLKSDYDRHFMANGCSARLSSEKGDLLLDEASLILQGESLALKNKRRNEKFKDRSILTTPVKKKIQLSQTEQDALDFATGLFNPGRSSKMPKPRPQS